jgi:hypothetical protein
MGGSSKSVLLSISCAAALDQFPLVAGTQVHSDCYQLMPFCSFLGLFAPVHAQDVQIRSVQLASSNNSGPARAFSPRCNGSRHAAATDWSVSSVSQHECSGILGHSYTILIIYLSLIYTMLAGHCADCAPVSFSLGGPLHIVF